MNAQQWAAVVLLWLGVAAEVACCVGVGWMRDVFDRLHFAAAATGVGPVLVAVAVLIVGGGSIAGTVEAVTAAAALLLVNPLVTHATARAARRLIYGDVGPAPGEAHEP